MEKEERKLSIQLVRYLYSLKENGKNEVYETLILMMLNDKFINILESLIRDHVKRFKPKEKSRLAIHSPQKYEECVDLVCQSKYFIENFTVSEIERKRIIGKNLIVEIVTQFVFAFFKNDPNFFINYHKITFPTIEHESFVDNGVKKIKLIFDESTPLNELVGYLKVTLNIKNNPEKRKMSLGKSFRMLQIENEIRSNRDKYKGQKFEYIEQLVSREMMTRYGENLSVDAVNKSLSRIKLIKKQMNIQGDK